jgi:hypothetical protein
MDAKQATKLAKACVPRALSHLDRNKTVFHDVHIELRVARSMVQLMFVLGVENRALALMERGSELHSYIVAPWVISEGLCVMGYRTPVPHSSQ